MRIEDIKSSDSEAVVEFAFIVETNGAIHVACQESAVIVEVNEGHNHRGDIIRTGFHVIAIQRVIDIDATVDVPDDYLPLTIVKAASTDLLSTDVIMPGENINRGREDEEISTYTSILLPRSRSQTMILRFEAVRMR